MDGEKDEGEAGRLCTKSKPNPRARKEEKIIGVAVGMRRGKGEKEVICIWRIFVCDLRSAYSVGHDTPLRRTLCWELES